MKIVRDLIALKISYEPGSPDRLRRARPDELLRFLVEKVIEEAAEVRQAGFGRRSESDAPQYCPSPQQAEEEIREELGDLLEAFHALREYLNVSIVDVEHARYQKREQLGGFDRRWILKSRSLPPIHQVCWDCERITRDPSAGGYYHPSHCSVCEEDWPCVDEGKRTSEEER